MRRSLVTIPILFAAACTSGGGDDGTGSNGGRPDFTNGVSTLAGADAAGYIDGDRQVNLFHNPVNVAYGPDGLVYVADFDNSKLRSITSDGNTATVIDAQGFSRPFGLAFAHDGTLYVSTDNDPQGVHSLMSGTIWKVDIHSGVATPIAIGIGRPRSLTVLADGRIAAADDLHHVIELVNPTTGAVSQIAGSWDVSGFADAKGPAARFSTPYGIVQRADGSLVVADYANNRLRTVALDGTASTLAGSAAGFVDGTMSGAMFNHPQGVAQAANGDLYVTDLENFRVRRISGNSIETIAGDGEGGYVDSDDRLASELYGLEGIAVTPDGSMVYVADGTRGEDVPFNRVRQIKMN